jgi:hypothetical protein
MHCLDPRTDYSIETTANLADEQGFAEGNEPRFRAHDVTMAWLTVVGLAWVAFLFS